MRRIKQEDLESIIEAINNRVNRIRKNRKLSSIEFVLDLCSYSNNMCIKSSNGGYKTILQGSTKRDLYEKMEAFLQGFDMILYEN